MECCLIIRKMFQRTLTIVALRVNQVNFISSTMIKLYDKVGIVIRVSI
jgi:hypothetical protein